MTNSHRVFIISGVTSSKDIAVTQKLLHSVSRHSHHVLWNNESSTMDHGQFPVHPRTTQCHSPASTALLGDGYSCLQSPAIQYVPGARTSTWPTMAEERYQTNGLPLSHVEFDPIWKGYNLLSLACNGSSNEDVCFLPFTSVPDSSFLHKCLDPVKTVFLWITCQEVDSWHGWVISLTQQQSLVYVNLDKYMNMSALLF